MTVFEFLFYFGPPSVVAYLFARFAMHLAEGWPRTLVFTFLVLLFVGSLALAALALERVENSRYWRLQNARQTLWWHSRAVAWGAWLIPALTASLIEPTLVWYWRLSILAVLLLAGQLVVRGLISPLLEFMLLRMIQSARRSRRRVEREEA